ncbi:2OG-Fe(II) oxygenase [Fluviispira sanaruensis]|uniref:Proline hydroxylase n=1 Tax=Fluviispira sanaruensis TaxID=2493639 RepID=A0A4P2VHP3_FLUSA|nr:2OG-Fe(II) oxygenase [Fluviispira sanaruensis]BBH52446.1 proline hydroxylase [Fluviispira sanaruensis]
MALKEDILLEKNFCIIDNFLGEDLREKVWKYFQNLDFTFVNNSKWKKVFHPNDGTPLESKTFTYKHENIINNYPTGLSIDILFDELNKHNEFVDLYIGKNWKWYYLKPFIYPINSSLQWHDDGYSLGAFIYYCHNNWKTEWGGELLVSNKIEKYNNDKLKNSEIFFDNNFYSDLINDQKFYYSIPPKKDRAIFIKSKTLHKVNSVSNNAGNNMRCSISGQFYG